MIALIDRGDCNFVEKVYQAQQARAAGVVVVDNKGEGWLPIMADDGTGERVQIPSIIISKGDGAKIKKYMSNNPSKKVQVEIAWGLPRPDGRVEWELWMPPNPNTVTRKFIQDFEEVMEVLGADNIDFKPMYKLYNNSLGKMGYDDEKDCTNDGKYCWPSDSNVKGRDYVRETLTQICVAKFSSETQSIDAWWRYVLHFNQKCVPQTMGKGWEGNCSGTVVDTVQEELNKSACEADQSKCGQTSTKLRDYIAQCQNESGDCSSEGCAFESVDNNEFETQAEKWKEFFPYSEYFPRVTINEHNYHGAVRCPHPISLSNCGVLAALCAAYDPEQLPAACANTGCAFGQVSIHGKCSDYDPSTGKMVTQDGAATGICKASETHRSIDCSARTRRGQRACEAEDTEGIAECVWTIDDRASDRSGDVALAILVPLCLVVIVVSVLAAWYIRGRLRSHDSQFTALQSLYEPLRDELAQVGTQENSHGVTPPQGEA